MMKTYKYRVKDGSAATRRALRAQARSVNYVWNYCCQIDREAYARYKAGSCISRPTAFDLSKLVTGVGKELGLHSDCVNAICRQFVASRNACSPKTPRKRSWKNNLDWIPVTTFDRAAKLDNGVLTFQKRKYRLWYSRPLPKDGQPKSWSISTDTRGRCYVNIVVELPDVSKRPEELACGIDLGLKTLAVTSDGGKIETQRFYRNAGERLAMLQSFGMKVRARALSAKIKNQRKHFLHTESTKLANYYDRIVVGGVSSSQLTQTNMAKSVLDQGWANFKSMLSYKAIARGATVQIVDEGNTTRRCSCCRGIPDSSPKGIEQLGIRHWICSDCGAAHDRDVNSAENILVVGLELQALVGEIPALQGVGRS